MPPTRKDSVIPRVAPTRQATLLSKPQNHDRANSILNATIQTIDLVKNLVPEAMGQGVLSSISGILRIVKNTFANQGDFQDLAEQCQIIGLTIWRATSGTPERQVSANIRRALSDLQSSVDGIREAVEEKAQKNIGSKVFNVTLNQEAIAQWKNDLNRFLVLFNTELNISANLKLDELLASFQEFRATATLNLQADIQMPDELPVRPKIFVGRDELVRNTVQSLLQCRDVALIGPGGMGKSTIARAVLNDEALATKFPDRRIFVRYDDMDAAQITFGTFLDRIGRALGFNSTSANAHSLITRALSTSETLLVLDNAETFLDSAVDAGRIADAIDGFGARPNVAILLTTRTTVLPPNLKWIRLRVPALDESPACEAFMMFYTPPIDPPTLVKLLSAVDFHPLSINLLAQAAVQNEWSPEQLIAAWDRQRAVLLESGDGKIQSIAVTIETSLNSPSIVKLGETVRHLLQIIAYLPQGVSKSRLTAIFPGISNIESCADALCKQSLAYLNDDFITLLAPIRLYVLKRYNTPTSNNPLLQKLRAYYKAHADEQDIVRQDDVNIEHVLIHWLGDPTEMVHVLDLTSDFIYTLLDCRPRPVALRPVVSALDPDKALHSVSCMSIFKASSFSNPRKVQALVEIAQCLFAISTLMRWIGLVADADSTIAEARERLGEAGRAGRQRLLLLDWGEAMIYAEQGNYMTAEKLFQSALKRASSMFIRNRALESLLKFGLGDVTMLRGRPGSSKTTLEALPTLRKANDPSILVVCWQNAGFAEIFDGHLDLAQKYFQEAKDATNESMTEMYTMSLVGLAEVADRKGDHTEARALRAQAFELVKQMPDQTVAYYSSAMSALAGYLAMEGNVEHARELVGPALANSTKHLSVQAVRCRYLAGCIELCGGDFDKATEYFQDNIEECKAVTELSFRALSERALGEIAIVKKDLGAAKTHFEATSKLCEIMGIPKDCMYRQHACYQLSETFDGWTLYIEGHPMFRT